MPDLKLQQAARERAKKIREISEAFRKEISIQRIAEIQTTASTEEKPNVRLFVVKLPTRKSQREAA